MSQRKGKHPLLNTGTFVALIVAIMQNCIAKMTEQCEPACKPGVVAEPTVGHEHLEKSTSKCALCKKLSSCGFSLGKVQADADPVQILPTWQLFQKTIS